VFAVILVAALFFAGLYSLVGIVYNKLNYEEISSVAGLPMKEDGVVNILLIGNDSRTNGEDGRSDAMILLSISSRTKTIYMTSLLRDMYVEIPGHDGNRLNAAYSFGGAELLMETVEKNLGITINRCMQVNFEAFANLVDAVGGVDLELTQEEVVYVNGYLVEYNMLLDRPQGTDNLDTSVSGLIHLNGAQALAYCRNRYLGTDFGRTERQRKVLTAVIKKLPVTLLTNGSELFDGLMPNLTTNLTKNECFRLSLMAGKLITYDIVSDSIPQPDTYKDVTIRKMAVLEVDFETNKKYLREKLYGE
jgi:LCP family protein required for cell wall assembly